MKKLTKIVCGLVVGSALLSAGAIFIAGTDNSQPQKIVPGNHPFAEGKMMNGRGINHPDLTRLP